MKSLRRCVVGAGAVALAMVGGARDAKAAGFANTRVGGEEGTPTATNPTALFLNPAGIAFAKGSQLGLYASMAFRHATWTRAPAPSDLQDPGAQVGNYGTATLLNAFGGPQLGGTLKLGNLALGAGFFAPFGGSFHWDKVGAFPLQVDRNSTTKMPTYPAAAGGVQRWFNTDGFLRSLYFTAGAAYRLGPLSIGATANFISTTITQDQSKNPGIQGPNGPTTQPDSNNEGHVFVDLHGFDWSFAVGAMLEIIPDELYVGGSYQAQPALGAQKLTGIQATTDSGGKHTQQFDVNFTQNLPDIVRAGIRWHMKNAPLEFRLFGDLTRWSRMASQCLAVTSPRNPPCTVTPDGSDPVGSVQQFSQRNLVDTWGARLGVTYWVIPRIGILFGAGYETAAVPDSTLAPDLMDAVNYQGTLGARFALTDSLFLSAEYTHIQYVNRDTTGKSIFAVRADGTPLQSPTVAEDSGGIYTQWLGIATGNLEAIF